MKCRVCQYTGALGSALLHAALIAAFLLGREEFRAALPHGGETGDVVPVQIAMFEPEPEPRSEPTSELPFASPPDSPRSELIIEPLPAPATLEPPAVAVEEAPTPDQTDPPRTDKLAKPEPSKMPEPRIEPRPEPRRDPPPRKVARAVPAPVPPRSERPQQPARQTAVSKSAETEATSLSGNDVSAIRTDLSPRLRVPPKYPPFAYRARIEGTVTVEFTITPDGSVKDPVVVFSDPPEVFERAVLLVIDRWKFQPTTINGRPVPQRARQDVHFRLQGS